MVRSERVIGNVTLHSLTQTTQVLCDAAQQVLAELKEYAPEVDVDFVRKAVRAIGRCAIKVEVSIWHLFLDFAMTCATAQFLSSLATLMYFPPLPCMVGKAPYPCLKD